MGIPHYNVLKKTFLSSSIMISEKFSHSWFLASSLSPARSSLDEPSGLPKAVDPGNTLTAKLINQTVLKDFRSERESDVGLIENKKVFNDFSC